MKVTLGSQAFVGLLLLLGPLSGRSQTGPAAVGPEEAPQKARARATLKQRPAQSPEDAAETLRISKLAIINGAPYDQPSAGDTFRDYLRDSYGLPALARTTVRALYSQGRGKPEGWGTDFPGFAQRFASAAGITAINGNVRYGMEALFHEDLRYLACHGCGVRAKIENALLAEITARHDEDGHRFFTLTPTIADFTGPIIAHSLWYPGGPNPAAGAVSARLVFATRVGGHLFQEFVLERRHKGKSSDR